jgi:predicted ABC-type ATPase/DNA-binding transcriptional ArsR family regulator
MFTENQAALLSIMSEEPDRAFSMSELGRRIGKSPGVFQRGLNSLEASGYILSRREANKRLLRINASHPLSGSLRLLIEQDVIPLRRDMAGPYASRSKPSRAIVAEPPGDYAASALKILIIAGPNGAGKTTFAHEYLVGEADCPSFINADYIAFGLSPLCPERAALKAGKVMLAELNERLAKRESLAIESTLSGRRYARLIPEWQQRGYSVKLIYLSLQSIEMAIARVASRVRQGGHAIPEDTIRRRFGAGKRNFEQLYKPLVDAWALYDNSGDSPVLLEEAEK